MTLRNAIRQLRRDLGPFTQEQFAYYIGVTLRTVARWESPDSHLDSITLLALKCLSIDARSRELTAYFDGLFHIRENGRR